MSRASASFTSSSSSSSPFLLSRSRGSISSTRASVCCGWSRCYSGAGSGCLWYLLYAVILAWLGILYYFHSSYHYILTQQRVDHGDHGDSATRSIGKATVNSIPSTTSAPISAPDEMHIVFSTDCSFFQDWQTLLVFYSAMIVHQVGPITRIASGCPPEKQTQLTRLYKQLFPSYHVHFTPDFKTDSNTKKKYDFYNKPYGLHHWLKYADPPVSSGTVVILIDPDMILLRPFSLDFASNPANIYLPQSKYEVGIPPKRIGRGNPVAQLYGLGAPWTKIDRNFNKTAVCGEKSPCLTVKREFGEAHYSVGPPYLLERDDLLRLTNSWTSFVPR